MRVSVMRLSRRLRSERADHGLTLTQVATLATLDRHGPLTPRELADHEQVQPPVDDPHPRPASRSAA